MSLQGQEFEEKIYKIMKYEANYNNLLHKLQSNFSIQLKGLYIVICSHGDYRPLWTSRLVV